MQKRSKKQKSEKNGKGKEKEKEKVKSTAQTELSTSSGRRKKHTISNAFRDQTGDVEPIQLTWNNVAYAVKGKKEKKKKEADEESGTKKPSKKKSKNAKTDKKGKPMKQILTNLCGEVLPGKL